MKVLQ